jgi:peptidoglycan/LPS O-acetylase OafA/YrhL
VAILLVVLYHCGAWIPGGFVGVDVFFVISGFLITSQLVRELHKTGTISLRQFYARRARRILPAATLTTLVTVVVSGLLLSPLPALRVFGDARAAAVFGANLHFAAQGNDYFSADLPPSPLQHYWSLSVEEQFYLVWPLLLVGSSLIWLGGRRRSGSVEGGSVEGECRRDVELARSGAGHGRLGMVIILLVVLAAVSLAASVMETRWSPVSAYYSIFTRAWELAAGALAALALSAGRRPDPRFAAPLSWLGLGAIALSASVFDSFTPYPGDAALLPVLGAVAVIAGGDAKAAGRGAERLLGTAPLQRIGAWSYSWYLWHWPVLLLAPVLLGHSLSRLEALSMSVISLVLAVISFVFIERPTRRMQIIVRRPSLGLTGAAALVATSLAAVALAGPVFASLRVGRRVAPPPPLSGNSLGAQLAADLREGVSTRSVPSNLQPSLTAAADDKPLIAKNGCLIPITAPASGPGCVYGDATSQTNVVLFGDSHAAAWFPAVNLISQQQHWRLVVLTRSGCPAAAVNVVRYGQLYTNCPLWRAAAEQQIAALHPALVIVAYSQYMHGARPLAGVPSSSGGLWASGTEATFSFLHGSAAHVVFITDVPMLSQSAPDCVSGHASNVHACTVTRSTAIRYPQVTAQELRLAAQNHIETVNSTPWFCTQTRCPVIVGNILLYRDAQHMVPEWSLFLAPLLAKAIVPVMAS